MASQVEFFTKDLHFAAFLRLKGVELARLEKLQSKPQVYFVFSDKKKCEYFEKVFWEGKGDEINDNIKHYVDVIRDLRGRILSTN